MSSTTPHADRGPDRRRNSFTCPNCGTFAAHEWHALGYEVDYGEEEKDFVLSELDELSRPRNIFDNPEDVWGEEYNAPWVAQSTWAQSECNGCGQMSTWRMDALVHPRSSSAPFPHPDMPESVLPLYEEARSIVAHSRRAAAALARATMEMLLRELDPDAPKKARLEDRVLRVEGKVSSGLAELLTFIRHVGNQSLHVAGVPDDAVVLVLNPDASEPVEAIFEAINELVDELKTKPARNRRLGALVPDTVRDAVERKRQAQRASSGG